ncbi:MAG: ATP-binding protein [Gemmatimonadaceae bacterium]
MKSGHRARDRVFRLTSVFAPAAIVFAVGAMAYIAQRRGRVTRDWVLHTRTVLGISNRLLVALLDAETGQRGYVLAHDTTMLGSYVGAGLRADTLLDPLRILTGDNSTQQAASRAKAAFLASMSHELRTPLQAALGFAQLIRSGLYGPITTEQSEVLGRVERSQTHLTRLIDDILDFARLEAGRVRVNVEDVSVGDAIAQLAPLVEPQATKKHIELALVPPSDSLVVIADRHRLQQILVNLVGNAIKFTPESGTIRVAATGDGELATIHVWDTGPGIPADRLQSIFEPFVQVADGHTRPHSGVGLGLAISRDLARAMGGELTVESVLGIGSTFSVSLPLTHATAHAASS